MKLIVGASYDSAHWSAICRWLIANYDRVSCYDGETTRVSRDRLRVWLNWSMDDEDETILANFSLEGDDDLLIWFRLRFL